MLVTNFFLNFDIGTGNVASGKDFPSIYMILFHTYTRTVYMAKPRPLKADQETSRSAYLFYYSPHYKLNSIT